jgi:Tol biopolymer transport system component
MIPVRPFAPASTTLAAALAAIIALTACDSTTGPGRNSPDELLFMSTRGATEQRSWALTPKDIFRWNVNGGVAVNVTNSPGDYRNFSLSPDGRTVAYVRYTECYGAWVMNVDGSAARQVAGFDPFRCIYQPRISPDGSRIAFTSTRILPGEPGGWRIWVVSMSGGEAMEVSSSVGTYSWMWGWSPDGRVVFHAVGGPTGETPITYTAYIVNPDGSNLQPFFPRTGDHSPVWSPDRSRIAFLSDREGSTDVYVMNADRTNVRRITDLPGDARFDSPLDVSASEASPWSPDGTRIAFRYYGDDNPRLYSVRADGTERRDLTGAAIAVRNFYGWSDSGRSIAYTAGHNLFVADADGSNGRNLTTGGWMDGHALWLPRR